MGPRGGDGLTHRVGSIVSSARPESDVRPFAEQDPARMPRVITYSLTSGILSMLAGGLASLTVTSATGKLAIWALCTCLVSVLAGVAYESRLVRSWCLLLSWLLRQVERS